LKAVAPYGEGIQDNDSPLVIGGNYPDAVQLFPGLIDDVGVFSAALEDEDITAIIEVGLASATGIAPVQPAGKLTVAWASLRHTPRTQQ
jgi:hypothetical protein